MEKTAVKARLDKKATRQHILQMAEDKGFTKTQFDKTVNEISFKIRQAAGRKRLYEIERFMIMAQILDIRLDDLFVSTKN